MNLPNRITLSRILLIPVFVVFFYLDAVPYNYLISAIIFVIAAGTDFLDGHIARSRGLVTNLGKFLDPIADKVLVSTALVLLLTRPAVLEIGVLGGWGLTFAGVCVAVILARELIVSGFRMVAAGCNLVLAADIYGKLKTVAQDVALAVLLVTASFLYLERAAEIAAIIGMCLLGVCTLLTVLSGVNYIVRNRVIFTNTQEKK